MHNKKDIPYVANAIWLMQLTVLAEEEKSRC